MYCFPKNDDWINDVIEAQFTLIACKTELSPEMICKIHALIASAPDDVARPPQSAKAFAQLQHMAAVGAAASAALTLIGPETCYMISSSGDGDCLASVILPGMEAEVWA